MTSTRRPPAVVDLDAAVICARAYIERRTGERPTVRDAQLDDSTGSAPPRLSVVTDQAEHLFFVRRRNVLQMLWMAKELRAAAWPLAGRVHLETLLPFATMALSPAVMRDGRVAQPLGLVVRTPAGTDPALLGCVLDALGRFDRVRPRSGSLHAELSDLLMVRHAGAAALDPVAARRLVEVTARWSGLIDGQRVGLTPRDFYRNLLVGAPLLTPGAPASLTLIDFGESQKYCCRSERLAQLCVHLVHSAGPGGIAWSEALLAAAADRGCDLRALPLFLGLWTVRWSLWNRPGSLPECLDLLRRAHPGENHPSPDGFVSAVFRTLLSLR